MILDLLKELNMNTISEANSSKINDIKDAILNHPLFKTQDERVKKAPTYPGAQTKQKGLDNTIKALIKIYQEEFNFNPEDPVELTYDDFIDWVETNCTDSLTPLALDFLEELDKTAILNLCEGDPKMNAVLKDIAYKMHWINKDGYEIGSNGINNTKLYYRQILDEIISTIMADKGGSFNWLRDCYNAGHYIDEYDNVEDKIKKQKEAEERKRNFTKESLEEDTEEDVTLDNINNNVDDNSEDIIDSEVVKVPSKELVENAFTSQINNLVQNCWSFINEVNGTLAGIEFDYKGADKEDLKNILNSIVDDTTINIGMLYKVLGMIDTKKTDLITQGQEKAEEVISENPEEME